MSSDLEALLATLRLEHLGYRVWSSDGEGRSFSAAKDAEESFVI